MKLSSRPAGLVRLAQRRLFAGSARYWERRYADSGTSGPGSYGQLAEFKSRVLNDFVQENRVGTVVEFGCGDGNQLSLSRYPKYLGLDVSRSAINRCASRFASDVSKSFLLYDPSAFVNRGAITAELTISLDVLLHLVEDDVFDSHMQHLFDASDRYVIIFSMNEDRVHGLAPHVRWREFSRWVEQHRPMWRLAQIVENPLKGEESAADFFFYSKL